MVRKSKGFRTSTRNKLRQLPSVRPTITKFLREFDVGQSVAIEMEPSSHKGMPYSKFKGLSGKIIEKRGESYIVAIRVGDMMKKIISRPEHLKPI
ncbi:MAG: 50S ribosomal protein L21e [Candidatus Aenigmarchaeota archaeon]|nr:50S ribosomal protein L21e [Candidatus Aenigmarchaeota archaeon]